ncbi:MAG: DedA family protein [Campylobacterales bacterium]|nr:DedA family protein [Campylobacterales bacterium]
MEDIITSLSTYGYIILFFYSFGGGFLALAGAGMLSSIGEMNIYFSILIAVISNFMGDNLLFYLSRYNKKEVYPYLKKHRRKLALSHLLIKKYDSMIIIIKKFIYGAKTLVPIAIGLTKYDFKKFIVINFIASIIWGVVVGGLSFYLGKPLIEFIENIFENKIISITFIIFIILIVTYFFNKSAKNSSKM